MGDADQQPVPPMPPSSGIGVTFLRYAFLYMRSICCWARCMADFASRVPDTVAANISTTMKLANTGDEGGDGVCGHDTALVSSAALPNGVIFGSLCQIGLSAKPL